MKLATLTKTTGVAVLFIIALAFGAVAHADGISDSNTTTDGTSATINAGQGEVFTCDIQTDSFSCVDTDGFTCYGWGNCSALGATGTAANLQEFILDYGKVKPSVTAPEPGTLLLLCAGFVTLGLLKNRFLPVSANR
jgi:hypothetical protein